jgi:DNA-binding MarR family transcriptional regulator
MFAVYNLPMTSSAAAGLARRLVHGLAGARRRLETHAAPALERAVALDLDDFVFLETIAMTDLSPGEISAALRIPPHGVSRRLAALERAGLVRRALDPEDARRRVLTVTPHGRTTLTAAHATLEARVAPMLRELGAERSHALLDALTRLASGGGGDDEGDAAPEQRTPADAAAPTSG